MLTALYFGTFHGPSIEPASTWSASTDPSREECFGDLVVPSTSEGDFVMRTFCHLGNLGPGQSKTVKLAYERM